MQPASNCIFCDRREIADNILHETDNFISLVGKTLITPGHILMVTKQHYSCFGEIPDELEPEYERFKSFLRKKVELKFSHPFFVEYGPTYRKVDHPHVQVVPSEGDGYRICSIVKEMVMPGVELGIIGLEEVTRNKLKEICAVEKGYPAVIEENESVYICRVLGLQREAAAPFLALRRFFTDKKGLKGISSWEQMSPEFTERDEFYRQLTRNALM